VNENIKILLKESTRYETNMNKGMEAPSLVIHQVMDMERAAMELRVGYVEHYLVMSEEEKKRLVALREGKRKKKKKKDEKEEDDEDGDEGQADVKNGDHGAGIGAADSDAEDRTRELEVQSEIDAVQKARRESSSDPPAP